MPPTGDPLARRYRRLLIGYPRDWRRARADEVVAVLLDTATPGRTRPTTREAVNLLRHGLRARLGRPASRTVVAWATLAAVICGLFTAALATWAAWHTARPLPDRAAARAVVAEVLPGHEVGGIDPAAALFTFYSQPLRARNLDSLLLGDGGEYQQASVTVAVTNAPTQRQEVLALARRRLDETGWRTYPTHVRPDVTCRVDGCTPTGAVTEIVTARRGDTALTLTVAPRPSIDDTYVTVGLSRATPTAVPFAAVAGGLLGAAAGWLLFGWVSRRTERPHPAAGTVTVLYAATMLLWWAPVLLAAPSLFRHHLGEPHPVWHPLWEWLGQPALSLFFVVGAGCALCGLALAALPRRGPLPYAADQHELLG
ncbi:hypothetical protein [Micromonospora globbae]|uniref:hypothetical protein n=1 Tax=Micromonospora globbae TaxID=1894969 RepID=UPI0038651B63|nr:hypothetical protein OH732_02135 [Micromonospora globbae]